MVKDDTTRVLDYLGSCWRIVRDMPVAQRPHVGWRMTRAVAANARLTHRQAYYTLRYLLRHGMVERRGEGGALSSREWRYVPVSA